MTLPTISEEGWIAVTVALLSGAVLEFIRRKLPSRDTALASEREAETKFRDQLLQRINELNDRVGVLEVSAADWQKKYYEEHKARLDTEQKVRDLQREVDELREELRVAKEGLS